MRDRLPHRKQDLEYGKLPPQAIDLEEHVLGAILLEGRSEYVINVLHELKPEVFYKECNQLILESILNLLNKNEPADIATVSIELKRMGKLDIVGGAYYVTQLTNRVSSAANIEFHYRIVLQMYLKRLVIKMNSESITSAYDETTDVIDLIDDAEKNANILTSKIIVDKIANSNDLHIESVEHNKKLLDNKGLTVGVPSGFYDLDKITGGWQDSDLIILAARPAMGKTSLALELLKNPALRGYPIAFFSLEMSNRQLYSKLQSQVSEYPLERIIRNGIEPSFQDEFYNICKPLSEAPFYVDDTAGITLFELRNKARKLKREKGIKLLIIDYLQLMTGKGYNKENEVSEISKGLKNLAKELNIPIIALSQLSRAVETRGGDKVPQLSDLRDSGSIEQDADIVAFLHRPEYYGMTEDVEGNSTIGKAVVIIAKHRNGRTDNVTLRWIAQNTRFADMNSQVEDFKESLTPNNNWDEETPF